jgi:hypothetical protein
MHKAMYVHAFLLLGNHLQTIFVICVDVTLLPTNLCNRSHHLWSPCTTWLLYILHCEHYRWNFNGIHAASIIPVTQYPYLCQYNCRVQHRCQQISRLDTDLIHFTSTERRGQMVMNIASYSGRPGFKSRPWDWLYWLKCFVVFLSPSRQMPG